jgi:molecular chaperone GrpE
VEDTRNEQPQSAAADTAAATAPDPAAEAQRERDEYKDLLLRKSAEFDNYRKRVERDRQSVTDAAAASVMEELLPLVDDLERALKADSGADGDSYRRGVELIYNKLMDVLRKRGVRPIEALGADFDPYYHQAVSHERADGKRDGEIIEEFRRGYMLGDRLLRPSMVKVAKG